MLVVGPEQDNPGKPGTPSVAMVSSLLWQAGHDELRRMVSRLGLKPRYILKPGTPSEWVWLHGRYGRMALEEGAVQVGQQELEALIERKRVEYARRWPSHPMERACLYL